MIRTFAAVAVTAIIGLGSAGLGPAWSETAQRAPRQTDRETAAPAAPLPNPLDVPKWMGQAIEHILTDGTAGLSAPVDRP